MRLATSKIVYREDLYPRFKPNPSLIQTYAENLDQLPPVEVNQHNELIDGYHRWKAHETAGEDDVEVTVTETKSDEDSLSLAIERNACHGWPLSADDKRRLAQRFYLKLPVAEIAARLHVSERTVTERYLKEQIANRTRKRNRAILDELMQEPVCESARRSQEEIADAVTQKTGIDCHRSMVSRVSSTFGVDAPTDGGLAEAIVNDAFDATKPNPDGGVDGITPDGTAIQTTMMDAVGRQKVDLFAAGMKRHGLNQGILVGRRITNGAVQEMERLEESGLKITFRPFDEVLHPTDTPESLCKSHEVWFLHKYLPMLQEVEDRFSGPELDQIRDELQLVRELDCFGTDFDRRIYTIWNFAKATNEVRHFGNIPPEIIDNLLYLYTNPFDVVFDPFGGGGSTVDKCVQRKRRYYVSDLNPIPARPDIRQHDITTGLPDDLPVPDLVFLDPPYWKQAEKRYSQDATDLGNVDLEAFLTTIGDIAKAVKRKWVNAKREQGTLALIIGPWKHNGQMLDLPFLCYERITKYLPLAQRIIVPYSTQVHGGAFVDAAKQKKELLYLHRDLMVFRYGDV